MANSAIGAQVIYCGHEGSFVADIHRVGDVNVVVANGPLDMEKLDRTGENDTHRLTSRPVAGYWNSHRGIFVVPEDQVVELTTGDKDTADVGEERLEEIWISAAGRLGAVMGEQFLPIATSLESLVEDVLWVWDFTDQVKRRLLQLVSQARDLHRRFQIWDESAGPVTNDMINSEASFSTILFRTMTLMGPDRELLNKIYPQICLDLGTEAAREMDDYLDHGIGDFIQCWIDVNGDEERFWENLDENF